MEPPTQPLFLGSNNTEQGIINWPMSYHGPFNWLIASDIKAEHPTNTFTSHENEKQNKNILEAFILCTRSFP